MSIDCGTCECERVAGGSGHVVECGSSRATWGVAGEQSTGDIDRFDPQ